MASYDRRRVSETPPAFGETRRIKARGYALVLTDRDTHGAGGREKSIGPRHELNRKSRSRSLLTAVATIRPARQVVREEHDLAHSSPHVAQFYGLDDAAACERW